MNLGARPSFARAGSSLLRPQQGLPSSRNDEWDIDNLQLFSLVQMGQSPHRFICRLTSAVCRLTVNLQSEIKNLK